MEEGLASASDSLVPRPRAPPGERVGSGDGTNRSTNKLEKAWPVEEGHEHAGTYVPVRWCYSDTV